MITLYVAVVRVDEKYAHNYNGTLPELKESLDERIKWGLGFRGEIQGSEVVQEPTQWSQLLKKRAIRAGLHSDNRKAGA